MKLSLPPHKISEYVAAQINNMFPDGQTVNHAPLHPFVTKALERVEHCFSNARLKGFHNGTEAQFSHRHGDQYAIFLYYLANTIFREEGPPAIAEKTYLLNKTLHGLDAFYEVQLPDIFAVVHPVGTVLGRATYNDYFCVYQNCTIGANLNDEHPEFGQGVVMYGGSRVIGSTKIGDNCLIATGTILINQQIPDNSVAYGLYPKASFKSTQHQVKQEIFRS